MILEKRVPFSYWLNLIKWDLLFVSLSTTIFYFITKEVINIEIPISVGSFLGTSIALLLSFKLSQSYDRWWEARKVWGSIVNDSRTLVIQIVNLTNNKCEKEVRTIAIRQIVWCYSLACLLRDQNSIQYLKKWLSEQEIAELNDSTHIPLSIIHNQSASLNKIYGNGFVNDFQHVHIDSTLVRLVDSLGRCERIKKTIFPKTYRLTLRFFIYLFLIILSISFSVFTSWIAVPLLIAISIPFLMLEKISVNIQNPFGNKPTDVSISAISKAIEINILNLIGEKAESKLVDDNLFYVM